MKKEKKTREELLEEINRLRLKVVQYEQAEDIKKQKNAEEKLRETIARHTAMIENIGDVIAIVDENGMIIYQSPNVERWFGWSPEELIGINGWDKMHPDDIERIEKEFVKLLQKETPSTVEYRFLCKDGNYKWIELTAINRINDPVINGVLLNYRDITERKIASNKLEKSEKKFRNIFENSPDIIAISDVEGNFLDINRGSAGLTREQIIGTNAGDYVQKQEYHKFRSAANEAIKTGKPQTYEPIMIAPDGEKIYWNNRVSALKTHDDETRLVFIFTNITEQKIAEKKIIETQLNLTRAQEIGKIGTWTYNIQKNSLDWTDENYKIYGIKQGTQVTPEIFSKCIHPDDLDFVNQKWESGMANGKFDIEYRLLVKGEIKWVREKADITFDKDGLPLEAVGFTQDITDRKIAELALKESQAFNESLLNATPDLIYIYDLNKQKNVYSNTGIINILGYSAKEVKRMGNKLLPTLVHPDDFADYIKKILPLYQTADDGELIEHEYRMKRKDGVYCWLHSKESIFTRNPDGSPNQIFGLVSDITERKAAVEEIETFWNVSPDLICVVNYETTHFVRINPAFTKTLGYKESELLDHSLMDFVHPDDIASTVEVIEKQLKTGEIVIDFTNRCLCKDGSYKYLDWVLRPLQEKGLTYAMARDVSSQVLADKEIVEAKETAERYVDLAGSMFVSLNTSGEILLLNQKALDILGYSKKELMGNNWFDICIPKEINSEVKKVFNQVVTGNMEGVEHYENEIITKSGERKLIAWYNSFIKNETGAITYLLSSGVDITESKKTEEILSRTISLQQATLESTADGILVVDLEGRIVDYNKKFTEIWSMSDSIIPQGKIKDLVAPENAEFAMKHIIGQLVDPEKFISRVQSLYNTPDAESFDVLHFKDGRIVDRYSKPQSIEEKPVGRVWSFRDVTEFKKAQLELQDSETKYKNLVETAVDAIYLLSDDGVIIETNQGACNMLGKSKDEIIGSTYESIDPDFPLNKFSDFWNKIPFDEQKIFETNHLKKDGTMVPVEISSIKYLQNEKVFFYGIARDITDRKKSEKELTKYRAHLEDLVKERTNELEKSNVQLARFNKLFVGREFRIKELRDKVKELEEIITNRKK